MGNSFYNFQVRADSPAGIIDALNGWAMPAFVSEAENGWVSIYNRNDGYDLADWADQPDVGRMLSEHLHTVVLNLWLVDDDIEGYTLYDNGVIIDEFIDSPTGYMDEEEAAMVPPEILARYVGQPAKILPYCLPGTTQAQLERAIAPGNGDYVADHLAPLFGILPDRQRYKLFNVARGEADFLVVLTAPSALPLRVRRDFLKDALQLRDSPHGKSNSQANIQSMIRLWEQLSAEHLNDRLP